MLRRRLLIIAAVVVALVAAAFATFHWFNARSVARLAAPALQCAEADIEVTTLDPSPLREQYEVRGCGQRAVVSCLAPDFECLIEAER